MSTPPPTYENYPPSGEDRVRSVDDAASSQWSAQTVAPLGPPPPAPGPDRRGLLYLVGGSVAGVAVLAFAASNRGGVTGAPTDWTTSAPGPDDDDDSGNGADNEAHVGDYTVSWPDGWELDTGSDTQLVLTGGSATLIFRAYTAGDDVTAAEEAGRLLNRHSAGLGKRRIGDATSSSGSVEKSSAEASGVRGDGVRVTVSVHVAIDTENDGNALAVIALLPSGVSAGRRKQVTQMRREFLEQLD